MKLTSFQLIAFAVLSVSFVITLMMTIGRRIAPRVGLAWGLLWIAAAGAIARPAMTTGVARMLGIARGADLVFYLAIIGMMFGFFYLYLRMRRIESEITRVVREFALLQADQARADEDET